VNMGYGGGVFNALVPRVLSFWSPRTLKGTPELKLSRGSSEAYEGATSGKKFEGTYGENGGGKVKQGGHKERKKRCGPHRVWKR